MIPIKEGVYKFAELDISDDLKLEDRQRRILMRKEYEYCINKKIDSVVFIYKELNTYFYKK